MRYFAYRHLPPELQTVSKPFGDLARHVEETLPDGPEKTVALRKLLESKDAAVRSALPEAVVPMPAPTPPLPAEPPIVYTDPPILRRGSPSGVTGQGVLSTSG